MHKHKNKERIYGDKERFLFRAVKNKKRQWNDKDNALEFAEILGACKYPFWQMTVKNRKAVYACTNFVLNKTEFIQICKDL